MGSAPLWPCAAPESIVGWAALKKSIFLICLASHTVHANSIGPETGKRETVMFWGVGGEVKVKKRTKLFCGKQINFVSAEEPNQTNTSGIYDIGSL